MEIKTIKEKYLKIAVVLLILLILVVLLAKNVKFNPLYILLIPAFVIFYLFYHKKKTFDVYKAARICQIRHYKSTGEMLNISDIEAREMPFGSGRYLISFRRNGLVFDYDFGLIKGLQIRELQSLVDERERSKIIEYINKINLNENKASAIFEKLNIDKEVQQ